VKEVFMARKTLVIIGALVVLGIGWLYISVSQTKPSLPAVTSAVETPILPKVNRVSTLTPAEDQKALMEAAVKMDLQNLQQRLSQERQNLTEKENVLTNLKNQQQTTPNNNIYSSQMSSRNDEIQDLAESLQSNRWQENEVNRAADENLRAQDSEASYARDQLDENIRNLELQIQQTKNQIDFWSSNQNDVTEQEDQLNNLNARLAEQQVDLNQLRAHRLDISSAVLARNRNVQNLSEQARSDLQNSQALIREQIRGLRNEIYMLQQEQAASRYYQNSLSREIKKAQADYDTELQQVKTLEESLQNKQEQLKNLQ